MSEEDLEYLAVYIPVLVLSYSSLLLGAVFLIRAFLKKTTLGFRRGVMVGSSIGILLSLTALVRGGPGAWLIFFINVAVQACFGALLGGMIAFVVLKAKQRKALNVD